jgi:hypothetical protein
VSMPKIALEQGTKLIWINAHVTLRGLPILVACVGEHESYWVKHLRHVDATADRRNRKWHSWPYADVPDGRNLQGMIENPLSSLVIALPGVAFIALGILIVISPCVLSWLVTAASILAGGAMLLTAISCAASARGLDASEARPQQGARAVSQSGRQSRP